MLTMSVVLRATVFVAWLLAVIFLFAIEVAIPSVDDFRVDPHRNEVRHMDSIPAYDFCFVVSALPIILVLSLSCPRNRSTIVISVLSTLVLLVCTCSSFQLMCSYSSKDMSELCDFAIDMQLRIDRRVGRGKIWLTNGNLLAVARNEWRRNFLISNDHDFDFCGKSLLFENRTIAEVLIQSEVLYELDLHSEKHLRKVRAFPSHFPLFKYHSGLPMLDIDECPEVPLKEVTGCNGGHFWIPDNTEEYLTNEYGSSWRVPRSVNHKGLCAINEWW